MSKIARRTDAMLFAVCLTLTACQAGSPAASPAQDIFSRPGGVNVGVLTDEPGFGYLNPGSNEREGFDVDLYRWLESNVPPYFTPIPVDLTVDERERALRDGTVQLVVENYSITDERRKLVGFAGPYLYTRDGVLVRAGYTRIHNRNDLAGKALCAQSGTTALLQLGNGSQEDQPHVTVEKGFKACVDLLLEGQVDAVVTDQIILIGLARSDPNHLSVVKDLAFGEQERYGGWASAR